jgi:5-methylcytosine-specific restriction endonuclease McrA
MLNELEVELSSYQEPGQKPRRLSDEKAMYLLITDKAKYWRMNYRMDGKQKTLALGVYPEVSLADARKARDEARALVKEGFDPCKLRKVAKLCKHQSIKDATREVIRTQKKILSRNRKPRERGVSTKVRFRVLARDNFTCQYCGAKAPDVKLHIDHITALCNGGSNKMENLKTACADCNLGKGRDSLT